MDSIDRIEIDTDEHGFELVLTGDFVEAFTDYLGDEDATEVRLNLHAAAFEFGSSPGLAALCEWAADGRAARREVLAGTEGHNDGDGYDLDSPKHPTYYERMVDHAD